MKFLSVILCVTFFFSGIDTFAKTNADGVFELKFKLGPEKKAKKKKKVYKSRKEANKIRAKIALMNEPLTCRFDMAKFVDSRQNKDTIGTNFLVPLSPYGIDLWLEDAVKQLVLAKLPKAKPDATDVIIKPELTRLYSYNEAMNLNGIIAFKASFIKNDETLLVKHYRGIGVKPNWRGSTGEYNKAVNIAAKDAMPKLIKSLRSVCDVIKQS